jgi:hypothetical protein
MRSDSRLAVKGTDNLREGLAAMSNESLREHYRPAHVNLLFVGEAPPASGRFFYRCNSGLYRAIRGAFVAAFPTLHDLEFLESFQALGCYLVDLCDKPIDRLEKQNRTRACRQSEVRLAKTIGQLQPGSLISVVCSISGNVERAREHALWSGPTLHLPYPGRWHHHRTAFEHILVPVLRRELTAAARSL